MVVTTGRSDALHPFQGLPLDYPIDVNNVQPAEVGHAPAIRHRRATASRRRPLRPVRPAVERYRKAVYARLRRYTWALDQTDDRLVTAVAREELPRYVRYWMALLAEHEPSASGHCQNLLPMVASGKKKTVHARCVRHRRLAPHSTSRHSAP